MATSFVRALERDSLDFVHSIDSAPLIGSVIRGDATREGYVDFLRSTYHYVRWSGSLLTGTAEGMRRTGRTPWLLELLDVKAAEESPHDAWVLDDLVECGERSDWVKEAVPPLAISAYVTWGHCLAEGGSPGYLGAAYTLEFISAHRAQRAADNLRQRATIPNIARSLSFLVGHGDADGGHIAALEMVLERVDDPSDQNAISLSAAVMRELYPRFFSPSSGR